MMKKCESGLDGPLCCEWTYGGSPEAQKFLLLRVQKGRVCAHSRSAMSFGASSRAYSSFLVINS